MYFFNYTLIERLPKLLGTTKTELIGKLGVNFVLYNKWQTGDITCEKLVHLCNVTRISLSHFLTATSHPEDSKLAADYVVPKEEWRDVIWKPEVIGTLFGDGSLTGLTKTAAAEKLDLYSYQAFDSWAASSSAARMNKVVEMLNAFHIDASLLFEDPNVPIPLPAWGTEDNHISEIVERRMKEYRTLERKNMEQLRTIRSLRTDVGRLQKENAALKMRASEKKEAGPFAERGYAFNLELWHSLPELLCMNQVDFCRSIGVSSSVYLNISNISTDTLIKACNLYCISVSHFFIPKNEPVVIYDAAYYQTSSRLFVPVESRMERLKYLFGKYGVIESNRRALGKTCGIRHTRFNSILNGTGEGARVLTIADVCTTYNLPPWIFFHDENRKKPLYAQSQYERILLNAIEMSMDIERLTGEVRDLKAAAEKKQ